nr:hypothetical protein GCM10020092_059150 [Actinoplanes digitatis]
MSLDWEPLDRHMQKAEHAEVTALLLAATEQERLASAARVEARIRATRADDWWTHGIDPAGGYALAVIGCMPSPARAAALLCRRDLRERWHEIPVDAFLRIARDRELPWLGDLGLRLAEGLRTQALWGGVWSFVSAVLRAAGVIPSPTEAVLRGWLNELSDVRDRDHPEQYTDRMRAQPFLDALLPSVFDIDGLGSVLNTGYYRMGVGWCNTPLFPAAVAQLVAEGWLDRGRIAAATVDRLVRGDRPHHLRPFVLLHDALALTVDELAAFAPEYARLLPDAPSTVAALAQRALRAVGDAVRLELDTLLPASPPTLLRKEKNVVKAQLALLDRAVRREPERAGEVLETVAEAFAHPALDIQERALTLVDRRCAGLPADTRARLAEAATALGGDLRARAAATLGSSAGDPRASSAATFGSSAGDLRAGAAATFGSSAGDLRAGAAATFGGAAAETSPVAATTPALPPPPAEMPTPIADAAELAEEVVALLHGQSAVRWERVLAEPRGPPGRGRDRPARRRAGAGARRSPAPLHRAPLGTLAADRPAGRRDPRRHRAGPARRRPAPHDRRRPRGASGRRLGAGRHARRDPVAAHRRDLGPGGEGPGADAGRHAGVRQRRASRRGAAATAAAGRGAGLAAVAAGPRTGPAAGAPRPRRRGDQARGRADHARSAGSSRGG